MNVIFMGTSSAAGSVERDNTYLLLQNGEDSWFVDVGGNPLGKLKQASVALSSVRGVIFTHFHTDHIYGLPSLLWGMWIAGRKDPLVLCCSKEDEEQLRSILSANRVEQWPIKFQIDIQPYEWTEESVVIDEPIFRVSTFPSLHAGPTVGIRVESGGKALVYSADTRPNERIRDMESIDVLIHEATKAFGTTKTHTSMESLTSFYPLDKIGAVFAVHLTDNEPYSEALSACDPSISGKITLASDMLRISL
jgi:ribonuclease Z